MDDIEIYLNRLCRNEEIYAGCSEKLGSSIADRNDLEKYLADVSEDISLKLYVSDEEKENAAVSEILETVKACSEKNSHIKYSVIEGEFLNLIDAEGHITANAKPRKLVHRDGDLHAAVHIWIIRRRDMGVYVLLQKRSHWKEICPDLFDVSAAGHVSQGEELRSTAVRETAEELGLDIHGSKLEFLGMLENHYHKDQINDNELRAVYLCREPIDDEKLSLQKSEVSDVCWAEIDEMLAVMGDVEFDHCIDLRELSMIKKAVF